MAENSDPPILQVLEKGDYLKPGFNRNFHSDVTAKIEEFSKWFNSRAKLYMLNCDSSESDIFVSQLLALKTNIEHAVTTINKSLCNWQQVYTCRVCGDTVLCATLQDHEHFEAIFSSKMPKTESAADTFKGQEALLNSFKFDFKISEEVTASSPVVPESTLEVTPVAAEPQHLPTSSEIQSSSDLNSFKFNFVISYDKRIEETLYPENLLVSAKRYDKISDYTIQKCGPHRGYCLLCPCNLSSKNRAHKINAFVVQNHVSGQRHLKFAVMDVNKLSLQKYHDFWRAQDSSYQAHQVYFTPEITLNFVLRCNLCNDIVTYNSALQHIKGASHKKRILKLVEVKPIEYYLIDMQVSVYNIVAENNDLNPSPRKERVISKSESSVTSNGACEPKKCFIEKNTMTEDVFFLPERFKEHRQFFSYVVSENKLIVCSVCNVTFYGSPKNAKSHIFTVQHRQKSRFAVAQKYDFYCEICNSVYKDEQTWDEHFIKGPNRHDKMAAARKPKVSEYECETCLTVIFGDGLSLTRHITARSAKNGNKKPEITLPPTVKKLFRSKAFLEEEGLRLKTEAMQVLENQMRDCCEDLQITLGSIYPNCRAYPFGSRISGLGNNQSDLDVYMDTSGEMYTGTKNQDPVAQKQIVDKTYKIFKQKKDVFTNVLAIPCARTPIVKLQHCFTKLDCDVSFRHGLGVENTKFLRYCMNLQPITQPFILLLKKWSNYCNLNEHVTNYGLALMAIFYLQNSEFLLSVRTIRNYNPKPSLVIDGWETINYTVPIETIKTFVRPYPSTLKQLLREFFYYFSIFDYANLVICPLLGHTVPKMLFLEQPGCLPPEMKTYIQRIQTDGEIFRGNSPFCVQDPFDLSHNVTKACQHGVVNKLKILCKFTFEFLDSIE